MILYNVTTNVDNAVAAEWLQWMQETHIPEIMATTYFIKFQIARVLEDEDNGGTTYAVQYFARHMQDLQEFHREHAPALQTKMQERYAGRYASFMTVLEVVD